MNKNDICKVGVFFGGVFVSVLFIYGCYWVAKTVSYNLFYEDMVRATIIEMVDPESIRKPDVR